MWKRFVRAIKSLFGGLISSVEDPKLILEQNMREPGPYAAENLTDAAEIHELGKGILAQVSGGPAPRLVIDFQHVRQASSATT